MRISDWSSDVCSSDLPQPSQSLSDLFLRCDFQYRRRHPHGAGGGRGPVAHEPDDRPRGWAFHPSRRARDELQHLRSEEHTSELQLLMRISYAVFCLKKKKHEVAEQDTPSK